jgi:hypothetical protein
MTQLSRTDSQFDRLLLAPLHENGEAPLSVLSALARQDIDAWKKAARSAELPKDHAVNSLASTIWQLDSKRWSTFGGKHRCCSSYRAFTIARLSSDRQRQRGRLVMWLVDGMDRSQYPEAPPSRRSRPRASRLTSKLPGTVPQPFQGPGTQGPGTD